MANEKLNEVYSEMKAAAQAEVFSQIQPKLAQLQKLMTDLEGLLGSGARPKRGRRGRKPGAAKKTIRKATKKAAKKAAKKAPKKAKGGKRVPKGALEDALVSALKSAGKPLSPAGLRDALLAMPMFKSHNPKNLYSQISQKIKNVKQIKKTKDGYSAS
ncbi:hypothetical protein JXA32_10690 [Candidatus Sumerlaeota bacterium]|nr:hypothetical protein [Candidatus Sumerlaeota bacterium]